MQLVQLANTGTHERVMAHFKRFKPGTVLDLPCGPGALSQELIALGYQVTPADIHPEGFQLASPQALYCDLNQRLPFEDASFDYVACVEGIEHTENPSNAIRELARVLKPGGRLVLTTPNYLNLERRLKFLITGSFSKPVTPERFKEFYGGDTAGMHNSPMTYPMLYFFLGVNNFKTLSMEKEKTKWKQWFLLPTALLIWGYARLWSPKQRRKYLLDEVNSNVILMGGNNLIMVCEKQA